MASLCYLHSLILAKRLKRQSCNYANDAYQLNGADLAAQSKAV